MKKFLIVSLLALLIVAVFYWLPDSSLSYKGQFDSYEKLVLQEDSLAFGEMNLLVEAEGVSVVRTHCTGCHSEKLVVQNRASREGWENMIRWMQQTQNLGDLGENESEILDYLAKNYAPDIKGRREPLVIEWYNLAE